MKVAMPESERAQALHEDHASLFEDVLPFWLRHAVDREHGGYLSCLDRDGSVMGTDKSLWIQGRFSWLLGTLAAQAGPQDARRDAWRVAARHGLDFLERHGFDRDGRMFFTLTRDGRPLRRRRYLFSECFAVMARAAVARASDDPALAQRAVELLREVHRRWRHPTAAEPPKVDPATRPMKGLGLPMILIGVAQELREATADPLCEQVLDEAIAEIRRDFVHAGSGTLLETVGPKGEFLDTLEGRLLCPGHAIEAAWFLLREAQRRVDPGLRDFALGVLDASWEKGWDAEFGGLLYYRDARDLPPTEYWHDMKFWWPHNEAEIAQLLAFRMTGEERFLERWRQVRQWSREHFPDPEHGEWFGYLHRDGRLSTPVKGNLWKGPFHLPRMLLWSLRLLRELGEDPAVGAAAGDDAEEPA